MNGALKFTLAAAAAAALAGCVSSAGKAPQAAGMNALRVGVSPDYPPIIFREGAKLAGAEADFAARLAAALGRKLVFVETPWEKQIETLLAGRTDIIMSGMSITQPRGVRIAFSEPFLKVGIMPLVRSQDAERYNSREKITSSYARIGVQKNSTADVFVQRECVSKDILWLEPRDAAFALLHRQIDLFIHDAPAVVWLASEHEADLAAAPVLLTSEFLAWGVRKTDEHLLAEVNRILKAWKEDGTLDAVLKRWMPEFITPE